MMRSEERYWMKVSLVIGAVVLVLVLLLVFGIVASMEHIVRNVLEAVD